MVASLLWKWLNGVQLFFKWLVRVLSRYQQQNPIILFPVVVHSMVLVPFKPDFTTWIIDQKWASISNFDNAAVQDPNWYLFTQANCGYLGWIFDPFTIRRTQTCVIESV